jgi:hypothetical protein
VPKIVREAGDNGMDGVVATFRPADKAWRMYIVKPQCVERGLLERRNLVGRPQYEPTAQDSVHFLHGSHGIFLTRFTGGGSDGQVGTPIAQT